MQIIERLFDEIFSEFLKIISLRIFIKKKSKKFNKKIDQNL